MSSFCSGDVELVQVIVLEAGAKTVPRGSVISTIRFKHWTSQKSLKGRVYGGSTAASSSCMGLPLHVNLSSVG